MKAAIFILTCLLAATACNRRLNITKSQDLKQIDSSRNFTDSSRLQLKERELNITRYDDQLLGHIHIPASFLEEPDRLPLFTDSLESTGLKVKTTVTRDSAGNIKIGLEAKAKPVSVSDIKEKQVIEQKAITGKSEVKSTSQQITNNKQVTSTSMPWPIWLLIIILIGIFIKYFSKLF